MTAPSSPILQALYAGDDERAREAARGRDLDVFEAAAMNDAGRLQSLLAEEPTRAQAREVDDFTALHYAAFFGGPEAARVLVEHGADVNAFARNEQLEVTPLHSAASARALETARILLEHGADPNAEQQGGFKPLDSAKQNEDVPMQELLRAHGARES